MTRGGVPARCACRDLPRADLLRPLPGQWGWATAFRHINRQLTKLHKRETPGQLGGQAYLSVGSPDLSKPTHKPCKADRPLVIAHRPQFNGNNDSPLSWFSSMCLIIAASCFSSELAAEAFTRRLAMPWANQGAWVLIFWVSDRLIRV